MIAEPPPTPAALVRAADQEQVSDAHSASPVGQVATTASESSETGSAHGLSIRVGAGFLVVPQFLGSTTYRILPLPSITIGYGRVTASVTEGLNVAIVRTGGFSAGPTLRYRFGQYERDAKAGLRGLGDVAGAVEGGGTFTWQAHGFGVRGYAGWDLGTGHKGGVAELSAFASPTIRLATHRVLLVRVGPKLTFASQRYFQSYFGVDPAQASASGLSTYSPKGGLERISAEASLTLPIDRRWAVSLIGSAANLGGQAADSPRVRERGSPRQGSVGMFVTYAL